MVIKPKDIEKLDQKMGTSFLSEIEAILRRYITDERVISLFLQELADCGLDSMMSWVEGYVEDWKRYPPELLRDMRDLTQRIKEALAKSSRIWRMGLRS